MPSIPESDDYWLGMKVGVTMYAWWKNGVEYVGTSGKTLIEALKEIEKARKEDIRAANQGTYRIDPDT